MARGAPLHQAPHSPAVRDLALARPGAALGQGDWSQGTVRAELRHAGLGIAVSEVTQGEVRAAVTRREGGQLTTGTEGRLTLPL